MNLPRFSVENPVFVNLLLLLIVVGGVGSWVTANQEVFPALELNLISISTPYPRASAAEIEKTVSVPIENAVETVEGVDEIFSQSLEGLSLVMLEADRELDTRRIADDVRDALERLDELPEEAEDPVVQAVRTSFPVINVAVAGELPETALREVAREVRDALLDIPGVNQVIVSGWRDPRIRVDLYLDRSLAYGVDLLAAVDAVRRRQVTLPAGTTRNPRLEWGVRADGELPDAAALRRAVVMRRPGGGVVRLGDVAEVAEDLEDPITLSRVDGRPALNLSVFKSRAGDTIQIADTVRQKLATWRGDLPAGVSLTPNQDNSRWIRKRLETMFRSARLGFFLVCVTLFLFLDWRVALWTAAGIPVSFLGAAFLMGLADLSINMISLFSFIVVLGMVVDDAVVIAENIYRHRQLGLSPKQAAITGANEVALPVLAAVTTTVAAFVPMLVMTGVMGKFLSVIPKVVTFALLISLVEALIILPSHLGHMRRIRVRRGRHRDGRVFRALRRTYGRLLATAVRYRYMTLLLLLLSTAGVLWLASNQLRFVLFYGKDLPAFLVNLEAPPGTPVERSAELAAQVEEVARELPAADLDAYVTLVGGHIDPNTGRQRVGENLAQVYFELSEFETPGRRNGFEVADDVRERLAAVRGATVELEKLQGGPPVGKAVDARLQGKEFGPLQQAAAELKAVLSGRPGVFDVRDDYRPGRNELRVMLDEERAAYYGVDAESVALTLRAAFEGIEAAELRRGEDKVEVVVRLAAADVADLDRVGEFRVRSTGGRLVPLAAVTRSEVVQSVTEVNRRNKQRTVRVTAGVDNALTSSSAESAELTRRFAALQPRFPGVSLEFGGEQQEQEESIRSLIKAFAIAMVAIYVILGGLFRSALQPLLIMFAIPFGAVGVLIGHLVMGEPVGLLTLIGLTALTGIVVNDSLVMVDFINRGRRRGAGRWRAILRSGRIRLRPVVLTSVTTIVGFGNLALKTTGQAAFLAPMAIAVVWGLAFATGITLVMIPALVAVTDDGKVLWRRLTGRPLAGPAEPGASV